jgi:CRISPR system Cascade subunit CasB
LGNEDGNWKRFVYYLVAGLWANHRSEVQNRPENLAIACGEFYLKNDRSQSIEKRFIGLLDADEGQLAHRLRQMVAMLKEYSVDFDALREDLLNWNHPEKFVQIRWARAFYRSTTDSNNETETNNVKESHL